MRGAVAIELTRGYTAYVSAVDAAWLCSYRWRAQVNKHSGKVYAKTTKPKAEGGKDVYMHRMIAAVANGFLPDGVDVDHRDDDGLNNRRSNLRIMAKEYNNAIKQNGDGHRGGHSIYRGVTYDKGKWRARFSWRGEEHYGGRHTDEEAAARAYDELAEKYLGPLARINFPEDKELEPVDDIPF